ncbi:MAG TPA: glutamine--tRNA ligase/YqeY domain fusion protein, partial [Trueperaceae bacterium]
LQFGLAHDYGGRTNLRFDDTNPAKESMEFVEAIQHDIRWLGFDWGERLFFASDYFEKLYALAQELIRGGKAYVDSLSEEEIRVYRGTLTEPGRASPYRDRPAAESLELFERMRRGEFPEGAQVLRAKIDMASPNMKMRDPILYRILHQPHYRTGDAWHIYPMYDFQHPLSDALEGVTHSLCTLEFENNREVYDWLVEQLFGPPRPHQYEFGRHNIEYTVTAKRKLAELVQGGYVDGWDDPRMPTLAGLRRRGVTPEAIRDFVHRIGVSRSNSTTSIALLEHSVRDDLNTKAPRVMAVVDPLKVVLSNFPEGEVEWLDAPYWPHDVPREGTRRVPLSREIYIERSDFLEDPPRGFYRLSPGAEVRLRYAYVIRCDEVVRDEDGRVRELVCRYDPATLGRNPAGRKVKGTLHWVSASQALPAEMRLYDRLFDVPDPAAGEEPFTEHLNPDSLTVARGFVEPSVAEDDAGARYQFERQGYFVQDPDSRPARLVFNRIVTLRDSWAKAAEAEPNIGPEPKKLAPGRAKPKPVPAPVASGPAAEARDPAQDFTPAQRAKLQHYAQDLDLAESDALLLAGNPALGAFFEEALQTCDRPRPIANWIVNELQRELKDASLADLAVSPARLARLVALTEAGAVSGRVAKEVFAVMLATGREPEEIVAEQGLEQIGDEAALVPVVERLLVAHPDKVEQYRQGKTGLLGFFVGQAMRETRGRANPQLVQQMFKERLNEPGQAG